MSKKTVFLVAKGKVQEVMFRKTLMFGAFKRGIAAGGSNSKTDPDRVDITLSGPADKVDDLIAALQSGRPLNSIGAAIDSVAFAEEGLPITQHITHTEQFDKVIPPKGVEFYL
jgi:acylphosphatase